MPRPEPGAARARRRRGVVAIEFALTAPFLCLLALGTIDVVGFLRLQLRLEQTATELASRLADSDALREADLQVLLALAPVLADIPALATTGGRVVLSGLANTATEGLRLRWQRGIGTGPFSSRLGALPPGAPPRPFAAPVPTLVRDLGLTTGQSAITAEVFLSRSAWRLLANWGLPEPFAAVTAFATQRPRTALLLDVAP